MRVNCKKKRGNRDSEPPTFVFFRMRTYVGAVEVGIRILPYFLIGISSLVSPGWSFLISLFYRSLLVDLSWLVCPYSK